jgi:hypothetical protein
MHLHAEVIDIYSWECLYRSHDTGATWNMEFGVHMKISAALLTWQSGCKRNYGRVVPIILQAPRLSCHAWLLELWQLGR